MIYVGISLNKIEIETEQLKLRLIWKTESFELLFFIN
jgi:hypothetical protein